MERSLSERQDFILKAIVQEYVASATPVSSESIVRKHRLGVSPATVRFEMAALEEGGYITRPHVSAGGVPSDKGYRYYVAGLPRELDLPPERKQAIRRRFRRVRGVEGWVHMATVLLAEVVQNLVVILFPRSGPVCLRSLQLVYLHETLALLVLVLRQAQVRKGLVPLKEPTTPEELEKTSRRMTDLFAGWTRHRIRVWRGPLSPLEGQVLSVALQMMEEEDRALVSDYTIEGLRHLLAQPEFAFPHRAQAVAEALERDYLFRAMVAEAPPLGEVRVVIGSENREASLRPFSLVLTPYRVAQEGMGVVGVVGPTRMEYPVVMAGTRYIASLMSEALGGGEPSPARPPATN